MSFSASYASDQHVQYNRRAQDAHGPTPIATSNPQAQLIDVPAMPESDNTSNNKPEGSDPDDTDVCCPVGYETGNSTKSAHDGHAHTHQRDEIGETPTGLRLQPQALPSESSGQHSPNAPMMASTPGKRSASSVAVVQNPYPEEERQGSSRPLTTHGDSSSASERIPLLDLSGLAQRALAVAVQGPVSPLRRTHQKSGTEGNFIAAPSPPPQVRLSSDHSKDPRNPQTSEMLEDGSTQIARRPLDESGTRTTAPSRAHTPDRPGAVFPAPAGLDPEMPPVTSRDRWQALRANSPGHFGAARPSSSVSAQPSPRPLLCDSTPARFDHGTTWKNSSPAFHAHAPVPLPSLGALLSGVGQERGREWFNRRITMEKHLKVHGIELPPREREDWQ